VHTHAHAGTHAHASLDGFVDHNSGSRVLANECLHTIERSRKELFSNLPLFFLKDSSEMEQSMAKIYVIIHYI
jgi:hypothetical protein